MNVKAQGLLNGASYITDKYGREQLAHVLRACSVAVRDRYTSATEASWHPVEELVEFCVAADRLLGKGDGRLVEEIGAAGARANAGSFLARAAFYISNPPFLMKRIAGLYAQYNDEGTMDMIHMDEHKYVLRLRGVRVLHRAYCQTVTGWLREFTHASGAHDVTSRITELVERGDTRCVWETRWRLDAKT